MNLEDLHNHTIYSYDGSNTSEEIIKNAISNGLNVVGICDHQFSLRGRISEYINEINLLKEKYKKYITVKCGIEIGTRPMPDDLMMSDVNKLDYCLFESLDSEKGMDLYEFSQWLTLFDIPKGLAHTDIFALEKKYDIDMTKFLIKNKLFWEINTSGNYTYYYDFITNPEKQKRISESKITLSIGSDTHWIHDFSLSKLVSCHSLIKNLANSVEFL